MTAAARTKPAIFPRLSPAQRHMLRARLRANIRDAGLTDLALENASHAGPFWELEPTPLVLPAAEWTELEAGLRQRARFINALLFDVYGGQLVLREGLLPPEVVLSDSYYRRPCLNLEPDRAHPATLLRFDLVKTAAGWQVAATHANTPIGLGYAVQNRRFLSQEAGELYRTLPDHHSIINFPLRLLDALKQLAPRIEDPAIVLLTAGPRDPFYAEHSFLARKMGLPLVQGDDLLVLDNRVYFKTIAGLEPVDVIYRRLNDAHIDPVVFSTDRETAGVPGLLHCIRCGHVVVANAIGSGVAESRTLDAYLPRLMRFYLGEKPLLPAVPTYTCGDTDQLDLILDTPGEFRLRPAHDPRLGEKIKPIPELLGPRGLAREVREAPFAYVAQKRLAPLALQPDTKNSPPFCFIAYVLAQEKEFVVMPGGLVHLGTEDPPLDRLGSTADAIVIQDRAAAIDGKAAPSRVSGATDTTLIPSVANGHAALGSRTAENLFWLGRYLERAEATARMISILDDVALEEIPARDRRRWLPIWQGLLEATGHASTQRISLRNRPHEVFSPELARRMALDAQHTSSIYTSVRLATENARRLRDHLSPEAWVLLPRLVATLDTAYRAQLGTQNTNSEAITAKTVARVLIDLNAFFGTAERTMVHDAAWYFLRLGSHLERAIMTCSALRHVLGAHHGKLAPDHEAPELSALLRMLGSQDAYRRLYQAHSQPRFVADLLLRQGAAPRSLYHNLANMLNRLRSIHKNRSESDAAELAIEEMLSALRTLKLAPFFSGQADDDQDATPLPLGEFLADLLTRLNTVHSLLSDHYFSHQARVAVSRQAEFQI
ncbi:MAG TPA: circularly permuted type 2 ATP-grasp protein [Opitutaceae bacterium]|nr:circularly permuted type 2 ATP-grasp protein [Opitutaceae bacterium]